jgi:hypothetical protein
VWSCSATDAASLDEFEQQILDVCDAARRSRRRDGARTLARTARRIEAREDALARRTALDLQRLQDLEERYVQRRALALRQRWFVLGRVLDAAMEKDALLRSTVEALLRTADLRKEERACLRRMSK